MNLYVKSTSYKISSGNRNCYQLDLGYKVIDFTFCQLLAFRKKILYYSSFDSIETIIEEDNFILLFAADNKHLLLLDVPQILELREVVLSAFR
ncbi:hypothetical protein [uncultured Tenacibaculum sp.]|uniref:hypothetical protein n=1 Tax=uncultured Tenacibaculum sp. TaxID=174713 RepID=UPI002602FAF3|nr:hypothetical protein [uncultured Tenacibaculum sp.]